MFYDDKKTNEFEQKFQANLANVRKFMQTDMEKLQEKLAIIVEDLTPLLEKSDKTPEEIALILQVEEKLQPLVKAINDMRLILSESVLRQSTSFYNHVKQLAAEGNEAANKIYQDLKPNYEAMLRGQINNN